MRAAEACRYPVSERSLCPQSNGFTPVPEPVALELVGNVGSRGFVVRWFGGIIPPVDQSTIQHIAPTIRKVVHRLTSEAIHRPGLYVQPSPSSRNRTPTSVRSGR